MSTSLHAEILQRYAIAQFCYFCVFYATPNSLSRFCIFAQLHS